MSTSEPAAVDINELIENLRTQALEAGDGPLAPFMQGTFAMYPMADGGVMVVSNIEDGPMAGTNHHRLKPGMIRVAATLLGGAAGPMSALKGFFGRRKEVGNGG
jgi:hypothetical protein